MRTIEDHAKALADGSATSRALVEQCLARITDPGGEGARAFIKVHAESARAMADAIDMLRRARREPSRYAGIPVALKDLFDIAGEATPAGSRVLADAPPAAAHAPVVQRMLAAGFVPMGRTNMTEFAFSGLGINPHYGTPCSPWDRAARRIPGGSSSGTAVAVSRRHGGRRSGHRYRRLLPHPGGVLRCCRLQAHRAPRADHRGAAAVAEVGFRGTARTGARAVRRSMRCWRVRHRRMPVAAELSGLRLSVPSNVVLDGMDATVSSAFDRALATLSRAGARITHTHFPAFDEVPAANAKGGFAASEAYAWHRALLAAKGAGYDPRIRIRIARGEHMTATDYLEVVSARRRLIAGFDASTREFDALVMPTVPIVPPRIAELDDEREYNRINLHILRNTALGNFFDRCSISLPCHRAGEPPVGLMLVGETLGDARLFSIAAAIEGAV